ncbi:MAG: hypothetical protein OEZ51_12205 [Nitrospinota bacterium]|nr:hypothetical protein [Nitrospinota bacterium]
MNKLLIPIFLVLITFNFSYAEGILLGIAEDPNHSSETSLNPRVRVLFHKENDKWVALDSKDTQRKFELERVVWTIVFDGRILGSLVTVDDMQLPYPDCLWCFPRDKVFRIEDINKFPKLENKHERFGDWKGLPYHQPVLLVNDPNYKDKEQWKRFNPDQNILLKVFPKVKEFMKEGFYCNGVKINPTINNFELYRSYKNISGEMLISVGISKKLLKNCYAAEDFYSGHIWFYLGQEIKLIGDGLDLLDAGDYDSDGEVEFVFHYSGYNRDGYTLFDRSFEERYDYKWGYH